MNVLQYRKHYRPSLQDLYAMGDLTVQLNDPIRIGQDRKCFTTKLEGDFISHTNPQKSGKSEISFN